MSLFCRCPFTMLYYRHTHYAYTTSYIYSISRFDKFQSYSCALLELKYFHPLMDLVYSLILRCSPILKDMRSIRPPTGNAFYGHTFTCKKTASGEAIQSRTTQNIRQVSAAADTTTIRHERAKTRSVVQRKEA